jgi:hypothetical protein
MSSPTLTCPLCAHTESALAHVLCSADTVYGDVAGQMFVVQAIVDPAQFHFFQHLASQGSVLCCVVIVGHGHCGVVWCCVLYCAVMLCAALCYAMLYCAVLRYVRGNLLYCSQIPLLTPPLSPP